MQWHACGAPLLLRRLRRAFALSQPQGPVCRPAVHQLKGELGHRVAADRRSLNSLPPPRALVATRVCVCWSAVHPPENTRIFSWSRLARVSHVITLIRHILRQSPIAPFSLFPAPLPRHPSPSPPRFLPSSLRFQGITEGFGSRGFINPQLLAATATHAKVGAQAVYRVTAPCHHHGMSSWRIIMACHLGTSPFHVIMACDRGASSCFLSQPCCVVAHYSSASPQALLLLSPPFFPPRLSHCYLHS